MALLWRLLQYIREYNLWLALGLVSVILTTAFDLTIPLLVMWIIDEAIGAGRSELLVPLSLAVVAATLGKGGAIFGRRYSTARLSQGVIRDLRNELYVHLHRLSFQFYDQARTGQLMSKVTQDVNLLRRFLAFALVLLVKHAVTFVAILGLLLFLHWQLTLMVLATTPLLIWSVIQFSRKVRPAYRKIQEQLADLTAVLQENITGVRLVRAYAQEPREREAFRQENWSLLERELRAIRLWAFYFPLMEVLVAIGVAVVIWYGGSEVVRGALKVGALVAYFQYVMRLVTPLRMLGRLTNIANQAIAASRRIFDLLDEPVEISQPENATRLSRLRGDVRFEQVSFRYPVAPLAGDGGSTAEDDEVDRRLRRHGSGDEEPFEEPAWRDDAAQVTPLVLRDLSFRATSGQTIALLGPTGSGKSTIINLLLRFYDPDQGRILVDGHDLRELDLKALRRRCGIVFQETFLFSTSIADNIAFGRPDATTAAIREAAQAARIHEFIMTLPDGYETRVGERGVGLSGGQKQRVAIARAILMDPRILILDDATSSVDVETEHEIHAALAELRQGRTTFIVAQRLSAVMGADTILVLDRGRVVQRGSHETLLETDGMYRELYQMQLQDSDNLNESLLEQAARRVRRATGQVG